MVHVVSVLISKFFEVIASFSALFAVQYIKKLYRKHYLIKI